MKCILYNNDGSVSFDGDKIEQNERQFCDGSFIVVADRNDIDFRYTKLPNCYLWDVYKYLRCKKTAMACNEFVYPAEVSIKQLVLKADSYVQEITLKRDDDLYKNGFVLFEQIIASYCCKEKIIKSLDNWMYVAKHHGAIRIIVGVGKCVILSRFVDLDSDVMREVSNTLFYLRRFGIESNIKLIVDENFYQSMHEEFKFCDLYKIPTLEADYWFTKNFANSSDNISKVFHRKNMADLFDKKRLIQVLGALFWILFFIVSFVNSENRILDRALRSEKNINVQLKSECHGLEAKLDVKNFALIKEFALCLAKADSGICKLRKIYHFCKDNDVVIHRISINEDSIKIQTKLSKDKLALLKKKYNYLSAQINDSNDDVLFQDRELDIWLEIK